MPHVGADVLVGPPVTGSTSLVRVDARGGLPVVGRASERQLLRSALEEALRGTGSVVLLEGPAGIGKTRLLEALADDARAAAVPVRWGRCVSDEGAPALWPWRCVLAADGGLPPDVDSALSQVASATPQDTALARLTLAGAALDALTRAAAGTGLVVALEDLHWADGASLALLRQLAVDVRRSRLLVVATHRGATAGPLAEALADLVPLPGVDVLGVAPLPVEGVAAWLAQAAGRPVDPATVVLVHERSAGNPLWVRTLTRLLGQELLDPGGAREAARRVSRSRELRHLVAGVLRPLPAADRTLIAVAAVLGEEIDVALLSAVAGWPEEQVRVGLARAADAGVLTEVPEVAGRRRFAHALLRDGVVADLEEADRLYWHRRAAEVLEPLAEASPHRAGEVAFHWLRAGDEPEHARRALHWARAAAARAAAVAPEEQSRLLAAALASAERAGALDDALRAELLVELAAAEYRAGRMTSCLGHCRAAASAGDRAGRSDLVAAAALVLRGVGHPDPATVLLDLCDRVDLAPLPLPVRARVAAQRSMALAELGRHDLARAEALAAYEQAVASDDPGAVLAAVHARVDTLDALAAPQERRALAEQALRVAGAAGEPLTRLWAGIWRLDAAYQEGDPAAVDEELRRIAVLAADSGSPLVRWHLERARAARAAAVGRFDEARAANDAAAELALRLQDPSALGMSGAFRLCLATLTGDPADLGPDWFDSLDGAPDIPIVVACRASALLLLDRHDEAAALAAGVLAAAPDLPRDSRWHGTLDALVEVVVHLDDAASAEVLHALLLPAARWAGGPGWGNMWAACSTWRQLGRLASLTGRREAARDAFERAIALALLTGARPDATHARLGLAQVVAPDEPVRAAELAKHAAAEARRLGMRGPLARADRFLAELSSARPDPLTPREREVAELVAQSLTNRDVALRLALSERTVESHVRSILSKLGMTRRSEVVSWLGSGGSLSR